MGVKDEFPGSSFVKVLVTLRCLLQRNDGGVDRLGDLHLIIDALPSSTDDGNASPDTDRW